MEQIYENLWIILSIVWFIPFVVGIIVYRASEYMILQQKEQSQWGDPKHIIGVAAIPIVSIVAMIIIIIIFNDFHKENGTYNKSK